MKIRPALLLALLLLPACDRGPTPPDAHAGHGEAGAAPADAAHGDADDIAFYTCPMHPSVQQPGPGSCPICGMPLTPVPRASLDRGTVTVDEARRRRFGIDVEAAAPRVMADRLRLPAVVAWDPSRVRDVSSRVGGWVSGLTAAPGDPVARGAVLYRLYSPELVAAQGEWLAAPEGPTRDAARDRLRRWGVSEGVLAEVARDGQPLEQVPFTAPAGGVVLERSVVEGGTVAAGQALFRLADAGRVWVEGAVPEAELASVRAGQAAWVRVDGLPAPLPGKVDRVLPTLDPSTRTARVRVVLENPDGALRADQWATLELERGAAERLAVPETAVLYTGPRRVVFVQEGADDFSPREVEVGLRADGWVEITKGLVAGEKVVRSGTFLVAADSRLKQGPSP